MINSLPSIFEFYADTICDFLLAEPIVYFTGGFLLLLVCKIIRQICK